MADIKPTEDMVNDRDVLEEKPVESPQVAELTEAEKRIEKKLVRRIDWIIMPLILSVYLLNWIDRCNTLWKTNCDTWDKSNKSPEITTPLLV